MAGGWIAERSIITRLDGDKTWCVAPGINADASERRGELPLALGLRARRSIRVGVVLPGRGSYTQTHNDVSCTLHWSH